MVAPPRPVHVRDQRPHIRARVRATARTPAPVRSNLSYRPARFHVTVVGAVEWQFPRFVVLLLSESFSPENLSTYTGAIHGNRNHRCPKSDTNAPQICSVRIYWFDDGLRSPP